MNKQYRKKNTDKIYNFIKQDFQGYYVLERNVNIRLEGVTITEERIGVPLEVLESDFELLEEKDNE